jgi:hypothetical protein
MLGLSLVTVAEKAEAAQHSETLRQDVDACIAKIGTQVDYQGAHRATHWVSHLRQMNLNELQIKVETVVMTGTGTTPTRTYQSTCVTNLSHKLVAFRIKEVMRTAT